MKYRLRIEHNGTVVVDRETKANTPRLASHAAQALQRELREQSARGDRGSV